MYRYSIIDIRSELEHKRGEPFTDVVFNGLLAGFSIHAQHRGLYTARAIRKARQRGWMSSQMAHFFKQYAAQ